METTSLTKKALALVVLTLTVGCGSDDDSAKPRCEELVHTYCERVVQCAQRDELIEASEAAGLKSDCFDAVTSDALNCSEADDVSDDYGQCLGEAKQLDCAASNAALLADDLASPPDSCQGAILFAD